MRCMVRSSPLRAALVGCGKIGWELQDEPGASRFGICTHAAAWSRLGEVDFVAVADADVQKARCCAARWQVPTAYQDVKQLLDAIHPEIVSVATPDETHFSITRHCLEHPSVRAVLAEKPLATTAAEAIELSALANRLNKAVVVNYTRRFCPLYQTLRANIRRGAYGVIRLARILYTKGMRHNGSHALDLMQYWFSEITLKSADLPPWRSGVGSSSDPSYDVVFSLPGGGGGTLHNLPFEEYTLFEIDLCFDKARLLFTEGGDIVETQIVVADQPFTGYRSLISHSKEQCCLYDYLLHAAAHVVAVVQGVEENISDVDASISLLEQYERITSKLP